MLDYCPESGRDARIKNNRSENEENKEGRDQSMKTKGRMYATLMALIMVIVLLPVCAFAETDPSSAPGGNGEQSGPAGAMQIDIQVMSDINDTIHAEDMLTIDAASDDSVRDVKTMTTINDTAPDKWTYSFGDVPKYSDGEAIRYSITEESITDYSTSIDGYRITNTHTPDRPSVTQVLGIVGWDDGRNQRNTRPEKITVRLLANDTVHSSKDVSPSHGFQDYWTFSFDELPTADAQGNPIRYSIEADTIPEYIAPIVENEGEDAGEYIRVTYTLDVDPDDKEPAVLIVAPEANDLTYNGEAQELVTAGSCSGGTMRYALGKNASAPPDDENFETRLPAGTEAGVYYVWYYGKGDVFHTDTGKDCVSVEIRRIPATSSTISYDLNGGTLDGKTGTVKISAENGTAITLPAPTREGYTFDYWEGSRYNAGDSYTVNGDHTFTAQWKKNENPDPDDPDDPDNQDDPDDPDNPDDPDTPNDSNNSNDNGGTNTGDESHILLWLTLMTLSMLGLTATALTRRRHN